MSDRSGLTGRQPLFKYFELDNLRVLLERIVQPIGIESVDPRNGVGRYIAEDIAASKDIPEFNVSHVDGYAISECADKVFRVVVGDELGLCEAKYVETGQPIPRGTVAVVPVEATRTLEDGRIAVYIRYSRDHEVIKRGADVSKGMAVCTRGQLITPQLSRLLIELGYDTVKVYMRPRVLIVPTGSEFASGGKRESTSVVVKHMCEAVGGVCDVENPVEDSPLSIGTAVYRALENYDAVVTIGGVSLGSADNTVRGVLSLPGSELLVRGVKVQPGRASSLVAVRGKPVVMLPGLIQSTVVGGILMLQPVLKRLQGSTPVSHYPIGLFRLSREYAYEGRFASFTRVRFVKLVNQESAEIVIEEAPSPVQRVIVESYGFTFLKPMVARLERGKLITVYRAPGLYNG